MILWWRKEDDRDEGYSRGGMGIVPMVWQTPFHFHPTNPADGAGTLLCVRLLFPETVGLILALEYSLNFPLS